MTRRRNKETQQLREGRDELLDTREQIREGVLFAVEFTLEHAALHTIAGVMPAVIGTATVVHGGAGAHVVGLHATGPDRLVQEVGKETTTIALKAKHEEKEKAEQPIPFAQRAHAIRQEQERARAVRVHAETVMVTRLRVQLATPEKTLTPHPFERGIDPREGAPDKAEARVFVDYARAA